MPAMRERHVQKQEQQQKPEDRHAHGSIQGDGNQGKNRDLEWTDLRKDAALPIHDMSEDRSGCKQQGSNEAVDAIRIDQCRNNSAGREKRPLASDAEPVLTLREERLDGEGRDQGYAEQKASVQVAPESHERQKRDKRCAIFLSCCYQ